MALPTPACGAKMASLKEDGPMACHVCPAWSSWFTIANPLRRLQHPPEKILGPHLKAGMTMLDVGCGVGWFSVPAARMVGPQGRIVAVDLQQGMLDKLMRRAAKAGVADRIEPHRCEVDRLGVQAQADFALAFAMVHEVPDAPRLLAEVAACLKPGSRLLLAEPKMHVNQKMFDAEVSAATAVGLAMIDQPKVGGCRAVLLEKPAS
jgi:ubiquinone/menaquinone biosynthesis C-methylase UbiE